MRPTPAALKEFIWCCRRNSADDIRHVNVDMNVNESVLEGIFQELDEGYFHEGEWIDMRLPRGCFYIQHRHHKEIRVPIGESIAATTSADGRTSFVPMPAEMRGITLRQLRAIYANVVRRCFEEAWVGRDGQRLTPETVNLFDINKYIYKPYTQFSQASMVETLPSTAGTQPPRFFISHFWETPFKNTIACVEQMVRDFKWNRDDNDDDRGGGMTEDTPLWMCIFANNFRHETISADPMESPYVRAMNIARFRSLIILDAKCRIFSRIWPVMEVYLTVVSRDGLLAIYTAYKHSIERYREDRDAIGIVTGGAPGEAADDTSYREEHFPPDLIFNLAYIKVEAAKATVESDRAQMLNSVTGNKYGLDTDTPLTHPKYNELNNELNDAIRGAFAATVPALNAALAAGEEQWKSMLDALSNGTRVHMGTFKLDFRAIKPPPSSVQLPVSVSPTQYEYEYSCTTACAEGQPFFNIDMNINDETIIDESFEFPRLQSNHAYELVSHIPSTCTGLLFTNAHGETLIGAIGGVIEWLRKAKEVKELICFDCKIGNGEEGRRVGSQLANELSTNACAEAIQHFYVTNTDLVVPGNITEWACALKKMKNLKILYFHGVQISEEDKEVLRKAAHRSAVTSFKKKEIWKHF